MIKKINFKPKRLKFMKKTAFPDTQHLIVWIFQMWNMKYQPRVYYQYIPKLIYKHLKSSKTKFDTYPSLLLL
jgi:hypothetical protein